MSRKFHLIATAFIVVVAAVIGWQDHRRITEISRRAEALSVRAKELGIDPGQTTPSSLPSKTERHQEPALTGEALRRKEIKDVIGKFLLLKREQKMPDAERTIHEADLRGAYQEVMQQLMGFTAGDVKTMLAELRADGSLSDDQRSDAASYAVFNMMEKRPAEALDFFTREPELMMMSDKWEFMIKTAITALTQTDADAALQWIRAMSKTHPEMIKDSAKGPVALAIAKKDPKLAFTLVAEFNMPGSEAGRMIGSAATPETASTVLGAMRDYASTLPDKKAQWAITRSTVGALQFKTAPAGYDAALKWIESAQLNPSELKAYALGFDNFRPKTDNGRWMMWLADKLPEDDLRTEINGMMGDWTRDDYKAAGDWLNQAQDGTVKQIATMQFVIQISDSEPATAAHWAETLPPGDIRNRAVEDAYEAWKKKDKAAATAFARKNGLDR